MSEAAERRQQRWLPGEESTQHTIDGAHNGHRATVQRPVDETATSLTAVLFHSRTEENPHPVQYYYCCSRCSFSRTTRDITNTTNTPHLLLSILNIAYHQRKVNVVKTCQTKKKTCAKCKNCPHTSSLHGVPYSGEYKTTIEKKKSRSNNQTVLHTPYICISSYFLGMVTF